MGADYVVNTGSYGQMMIRDITPGNRVQLMLRATASFVPARDLSWSVTLDGVSHASGVFNFPGTGSTNWYLVREISLSRSAQVNFNLEATPSSYWGGPTTNSAYVRKGTAPAAPNSVSLYNVWNTYVSASFTDGSDNGDPISSRQIAYSTDSNMSWVNYQDYYGPTTIYGLQEDTTYYFWARTGNYWGWGPWSSQSNIKTGRVPFAPTAVVLSNIEQTSVFAEFDEPDSGGSQITGYQIGYGTDPSYPQLTISGREASITGLSPGVVYYFWGRAQNMYGWSAWSARSDSTPKTGAIVKVNNIHVPAIPYVKVNGVWRLVQPWTRVAGVWKQTT